MKTPAAPAALGVHMWDAHAPMYERVIERSTVLWGHDALVLGQLPSTVGTSRRLLDVACGTGAFAIAAATKGFDVTATDMSPGMIARLDAKIASSTDRTLKMSTRVVDGHTLDGLEDASFDVSAWRVLKPDGRLLVASWDASTANIRMVQYFLANAANKPDAVVPDHPMQVMPGTANRTLAAATFRDELEEFGFQNVHVHTVSHPICFQCGQEFVDAVLDHGGFQAMAAHKEQASLMRCILDFVQLVLDGVDPFGEEAKVLAVANASETVENHPLWDQPIAMPALAHIAVATKPSEK